MADEENKGTVRHEVAAVVQQPTGGDGGQFMTRYVNLVAWWPVAITLVILSSSVGVYSYFRAKTVDITYFMGFEDYASSTVLGAIPFFLVLIVVLLAVQLLTLPIHGALSSMAMFGAGRKEVKYEKSMGISCIVYAVLVLGISGYNFIVAKDKGPEFPYVVVAAIISLFLLSLWLFRFNGALRQLSLTIQTACLMLAPGISSYLYFDQIHSSEFKIITRTADDKSWTDPCGDGNRVVWMGSKAYLVECTVRGNYLLIGTSEYGRVFDEKSPRQDFERQTVSDVAADEVETKPLVTPAPGPAPAPRSKSEPKPEVILSPAPAKGVVKNVGNFLKNQFLPDVPGTVDDLPRGNEGSSTDDIILRLEEEKKRKAAAAEAYNKSIANSSKTPANKPDNSNLQKQLNSDAIKGKAVSPKSEGSNEKAPVSSEYLQSGQSSSNNASSSSQAD